MIEPLIAIDLGARPAIGLITGTEQAPVLLRVRRFPRWDSRVIMGVIQEWMQEWPRAQVWCESTFSHGTKRKPWLRDVGRKQEAQAGYISGALGRDVERVPPCSAVEANIAWALFGWPEEGAWAKGEHVRDMLCVGLRALIRRGDRARLVAARSE